MLIFFVFDDDIVDIEKSDEICSPTFIVDEFPGLFLHLLPIFMKPSRSA